MFLSRRLMMSAAASAMLVASATCGQSTPIYAFDLPSQSLKESLKEVTSEGDVDLFAMSDDLAGRQAPALHGDFTIQDALNTLLLGSGLKAEIKGRRVFVRPLPQTSEIADTSPIVVTGSRIRGAPVASPVVTLTQSDILESGKSTLGEAIRTLPQNFSGGQNPGIGGNGSQAGNANFNSSSSINLRGLGPDATLTLVNGHRVAYDANVQGIDVDEVPLAALDRIEIVPDGASALYGSDAVGGVANVILKKDFEGATVSARYGGTTDGGGQQQQYTGVSGARWSGGGFMAAFDYSHNSIIEAKNRSYTSSLSPDQTVYPEIRHISGILTGHQALGDAEFSIDALYSNRTSTLSNAFTPPLSYHVNGYTIHPDQTSYSISPKIAVPLGSSWRSYITGTYGQDRSKDNVAYNFGSQQLVSQQVRYYNSIKSVEGGFDGPLFPLFGHSVKAALGAGYRSYGLTVGVEANGVTQLSSFNRQSAAYGFGELSLPLISSDDRISGIDSLSASGAVRYEDYGRTGRIATPKFGLIYQPTRSVTLKASWGKSFKAPTLFQLYRPVDGTVYPVTDYGASNLPPAKNALELEGGNPDLKPERATTWTITAEASPAFVPGLTVRGSYFHTEYRQRVVEPITSFGGLFNNPIYQQYIDYSPSLASLDAVAALIPTGIVTESGAPYDPTTIAAVIDNRRHNAARQLISGVDAQVDYHLALGAGRSLSASGSASYLRTRQQLGAGQTLTQVTGQIFYMPNWNARGALTYAASRFSITAAFTYIGGVRDNRFQPFIGVASMMPVDLTGIYHLKSRSAVLDKVDLSVTVQNIFNQKPALIRTTTPNDLTFDTTNYPATGRFIGMTVSKSF